MGIMENEMETTLAVLYRGYIGTISQLKSEDAAMSSCHALHLNVHEHRLTTCGILLATRHNSQLY